MEREFPERAADAHFRPDSPGGDRGKPLIVLSPWLALVPRAPGSSAGAPTRALEHRLELAVHEHLGSVADRSATDPHLPASRAGAQRFRQP